MANKLFLNFSGGMNTTASPLIIKDTEAELVLNYTLDQIGALYRRPGYLRYLSQPVANVNINGLYSFVDSSTGTNHPIMVANNGGGTNGVIYRQNGSSWTAAKTDDTASKKSRFTTFVDYVFRVNGADIPATSADTITWGTTNLNDSSGTLAITPKFVAVFQDRVYFAHGGTLNKSRVWYSNLPIGGSINWDTTTDYFDVNPDDGDEITGLENNGNRLLIFKSRSTYRWTFGQVEADRLIGVGTLSQESAETNLDRGVTFFANPNGIYSYTGARPKLISRKIQKFVDAVTDWSETFAEVDYDHYYLFVGDVSIPAVWGATAISEPRVFSNCMFVYTISLDAWVIYSLAQEVTWMNRLLVPNSSVEQIYFGASNGRTYQFNVGTQDDSITPTTSATTIEAEFTSKEYMLSFPNRSDIKSINVFAQQRVNVDAYFDTDRTQLFTTLGKLRGRISEFRIPSPSRECNTVQVRISDNSIFRSIIEGFNVEYVTLETKYRDNSAIRRTRE